MQQMRVNTLGVQSVDSLCDNAESKVNIGYYILFWVAVHLVS